MAWIVLTIRSSRIIGEKIVCMFGEGLKVGLNEFELKSYDITTVCNTQNVVRLHRVVGDYWTPQKL